MTTANGLFITLEGGEGAGKTTNLAFIQQWLEKHGRKVIFTREPGGTDLGEDIRGLLLGHQHSNMSVDAELLLMFASRAQHIAKVIQPALDQGYCVLCDRFTDATYAYQGFARGIDPHKIATLETLVQSGLNPDLTLLLDLPVTIGLQRANKRSKPDRFEVEKQYFFESVRQGYLSLAKNDPKRIKIVHAEKDLSHVQSQIRAILEDNLAHVE